MQLVTRAEAVSILCVRGPIAFALARASGLYSINEHSCKAQSHLPSLALSGLCSINERSYKPEAASEGHAYLAFALACAFRLVFNQRTFMQA